MICAKLGDEAQLRAARDLIRRHDLLRVCGVRSDLVFLTSDGGDYLRRLDRAVAGLLQREGLEAMSGAPGGVHTAELSGAEGVLKSAALVVDLSAPEIPAPEQEARERPPLPEPRRGGAVPFRWLNDGTFEFDTGRCPPPRAWTLPLTNGSFGCLAADCGPAGMWFKNARELRVDHGLDGDLALSGSETLDCGGHSLFAAGAKVRFGFGWAAWEKGGARVTLFVPRGADARLMVIENAPADFAWTLRPSLAFDGPGCGLCPNPDGGRRAPGREPARRCAGDGLRRSLLLCGGACRRIRRAGPFLRLICPAAVRGS